MKPDGRMEAEERATLNRAAARERLSFGRPLAALAHATRQVTAGLCRVIRGDGTPEEERAVLEALEKVRRERSAGDGS